MECLVHLDEAFEGIYDILADAQQSRQLANACSLLEGVITIGPAMIIKDLA